MGEIICIAGSRDFHSRNMVEEYVNSLAVQTVVVTGGAIGPDRWASWRASQRKMFQVVFFPGWYVGPSAGPVRNTMMADYSDRLVAFWDGKSAGTKSCIDAFKNLGKPVEVRK